MILEGGGPRGLSKVASKPRARVKQLIPAVEWSKWFGKHSACSRVWESKSAWEAGRWQILQKISLYTMGRDSNATSSALRGWQILSSSVTFNLWSKKDPFGFTDRKAVSGQDGNQDYFTGHCNNMGARPERLRDSGRTNRKRIDSMTPITSYLTTPP